MKARTIVCLMVISVLFSNLANAQSEDILKKALEGMRVEVLLDMPATSEGVDLRLDEEVPMDFGEYSSRIKTNGIAIRSGDEVMITKIKKKSKHIEFHLGGGGYTFWDETTFIDQDIIPKSSREKELEKLLDKNYKGSNRSDLKDELADLKRERKIEQGKADREYERAKELNKGRVESKKLQGGSRFNIRYEYNVGRNELTVENVKKALRKYVRFKDDASLSDDRSMETSTSSQQNSTPRTVKNEALVFRKGITMEQAVQLMGLPNSLDTKDACGFETTTCEFNKDDQIIHVTFVEKVLVKYSIESN